MGLPFIVVGDQTDHGGQVVEGSPTTTTGGKQIARVGDQVTCPQHGHGPTTIVTGDETMMIDGRAAARHGDLCACGAKLIASHYVSTAGGSGSASAGAGASNATSGKSAEAASRASASATLNSKPAYDQCFLVKDRASGMPLVNMPYRITITATGQSLMGQTDASGMTGKISADMPFTAKLEAPYYGNSNSSANSYFGHDACDC